MFPQGNIVFVCVCVCVDKQNYYKEFLDKRREEQTKFQHDNQLQRTLLILGNNFRAIIIRSKYT